MAETRHERRPQPARAPRTPVRHTRSTHAHARPSERSGERGPANERGYLSLSSRDEKKNRLTALFELKNGAALECEARREPARPAHGRRHAPDTMSARAPSRSRAVSAGRLCGRSFFSRLCVFGRASSGERSCGKLDPCFFCVDLYLRRTARGPPRSFGERGVSREGGTCLSPPRAGVVTRKGDDPFLVWRRRGVLRELASAHARSPDRCTTQLDENALYAAVRDCADENANNYSSMYQDVLNGRRTEVDALNGFVVSLSRKVGLDAPLNASLAEAVRRKAEARAQQLQGA